MWFQDSHDHELLVALLHVRQPVPDQAQHQDVERLLAPLASVLRMLHAQLCQPGMSHISCEADQNGPAEGERHRATAPW